MAAVWILGICAVFAACMSQNAVFCQEEEPLNEIAEELQGISTDPQMILDLTANFASILQSLTKLEKPQSTVVNSAEPVQQDQMVPKPAAYMTSNSNSNTNQNHVPLDARDCNDVAAYNPNAVSAIYMLKPLLYQVSLKGVNSFAAYCDMQTNGGNWTVIHRREGPLVGFFRDWEDYKNGFGYLDSDHWLGLEKLHQLTVKNKYELRIDLEDFQGNQAYAQYDSFRIGDESTQYTLKLGRYFGTAEDSLSYHNDNQFSTKDRDNDRHKGSCAKEYRGAWWYGNCHYSNLNGMYVQNLQNRATDIGVTWYAWKQRHVSLKRAEMKIRRVD